MKNYVIINGVNSNTINGLGINELPPISKPSMRVQREEIDGRDGDITTNLGYSAYDKTITIGLFGTGYDINDIISFFNGEGTIVFSNEDDKYYKYKVINQIDYEALQKFKQATITFHCQPFKYPLEETPLEIEYEYIEQEGVESATMNNTNGGTSLKIDLKGNTSQYSTAGKQEFNSSLIPSSIVVEENGRVIKPPLASSGTGYVATYILLKNFCPNLQVGDTVYLYCDTNYDTENKYIQLTGSGSGLWNFGTSKTLTEGDLNGGVSFYTNRAVSGETSQLILTNFRITKTQDASWEPYTNGASPNPDYPQVIHTINGDNTIKVFGRNIWNESVFNQYIQTTDNEAYIIYNSSVYNKNLTPDITFKENTQYTIQYTGKQTSGNPRLKIVYTDNTSQVIGSDTIATTYTTYTQTSNASKTISHITEDYGSSGSIYIKKGSVCIIEGTDTTFYPYQSNSVLLTLGDKEICKIGNFEDKIFKAIKGNEIYDSLSVEEKNTLDYGKWYLRKNTGKVDLGTIDWTYQGGRFYTSAYEDYIVKNPDGSTIANVFCYKYTAISPATWYAKTTKGISIGITGYAGDSNILVYDSDYTSSASFKTAMSGNYLYYQSKTPTNEKFNDIIQEQLEDIYYNMLSYEGQTNVSQTNNDKPFLLDLIAMEKGTDEVVINNIGNVYAKPTIALEGTGETDIYLNNTEILKVDLSEKNKITIDTNNMEAYVPTDNSLANRKVIGNYNSMTLPSGNTTMKITGALTKATITDYTRWL